MSPAYGRSRKGEPAFDKKPTHPGNTVSTAAILTEDGIKAHYTYSASLTAQVFISYLDTYVFPMMDDGQTLIMDNHPVHHARTVIKYLKDNNIKFIYLPPYSPALNPIEEAFSKIKQYIKKQKPRTLDDLFSVINTAFSIITTDDANGYFNHAARC